MINYDAIKEMTPDDIPVMSDLLFLAEKAKKAEEQIRETYLFHIGEENIVVWHDGENNRESLTYNGVWQLRHLSRRFDVKCTAASIFEFMKADYLVRNGYVKSSGTKEAEQARAYGYFKNFLKRTYEKYSEKHGQ